MRRSDAFRIIVASAIGLVGPVRVQARSAPNPAVASPETEIDAVGDVDGNWGLVPVRAPDDTVWIADWTFDTSIGGCTDAGWSKIDTYYRNDGSNYWSVGDRYDGLGGVISGRAAILAKHDLCWVRDGYGNDWDYSIVLKYRGTATLAFKKVSDTESGFDFITLQADSGGASEARANLCNRLRSASSFRVLLASFSGNDPGSTVGPLALPGFGAPTTTHEVYIEFTSDGSYSPEDGEFAIAQPFGCVIDDIVVTGDLAYTENFSAALGPNVQFLNTSSALHYCAAPWLRLRHQATDNDKCTENTSCSWIDSDRLRIPSDPNLAFGPGGAVLRPWIADLLVSPWVALPQLSPTVSTVLAFRRFGGQPVTGSAIMQGWRVRTRVRHDNTDTASPGDSIDCVTAWAHADQLSTLRSFTWTTFIADMSPYVTTGNVVQIGFLNLDFQTVCPQCGTTTTPGPGPYIDRIRIGQRVLTGPVISEGVDSRTQAQDCFPTRRNSIAPGEHYSPDGSNRFGTCAFSMGADIGGVSPSLVTGDSITLESVVDVRQAGGIAAVRWYGAITSGPHHGKAPVPYTVGANGFFEVQPDSARDRNGIVVANRWAMDLDDTYFRGGDVLQYFWTATDARGGFTSDPVGLTALPASVDAAERATLGIFQVDFLPVIDWDPSYLAQVAADPHGDLDPTPAQIAASRPRNCLLYYQKSTSRRRSSTLNRTSFMYHLDQLGYRNHYDVYDVQGYGNTNNQLGGRANIGQVTSYAVIIEDDGRSQLAPNIPDGREPNFQKVNQADWYRDYLLQGLTGAAGTATLWVLGENTFFEHSTNLLFVSEMGLAGIVNDQNVGVNPDVVGQGSYTFWNQPGNPANFAGENFALAGGCPAVRAYDGFGATGTGVVTHRYRNGTMMGTGAVVMNHNIAAHWNTIACGFGWMDVRDAGGAPSNPEEVFLKKVLDRVLPLQCIPGPAPTDVASETTPLATALHSPRPNPFNPTTELRFDLATTGRATLRIYDAAGRLVRTLTDAAFPAGSHVAVWNGLDTSGHRQPAGVYFAKLEAGSTATTRKLVLLQ